jgi:7-cyano-7-deazaguanine synthase in queuosine biosynthesis
MTAHRLRLSVGSRQLEQLSPYDFLWRPRTERSSVETTLSPRLEEFGDVPPLHVDLVRLAVLVYLADRTSPRKRGTGVRWDRELELTVPVSDPSRWGASAEELEGLLHLLSGDHWQLNFESQRQPKRGDVAEVAPAEAVCLFSGGADSLAGALEAQATTNTIPVLVSHWEPNATSTVQTKLRAKLTELWGEEPDHHQVQLRRRSEQIGSEVPFPEEKSRRTRSFLFLSLGLAVGAVRGAEVWMSENGFTTINPPLSPERRGSLTTRTTHPGFLDGLVAALRALGLKADLRNPLASLTKGEVLAQGTGRLAAGEADALFSMTHSCGKTPWFKGFKQDTHCGLCFGCLVRRGSFIASGLSDTTVYVEKALRGQTRRDDFVTPARRKTIEAVRYRLDRRYTMEDLFGLSLPPSVPLAEGLALVNRGLDELSPVVSAIP